MSKFISFRARGGLPPFGAACCALLFLISCSPVHAQKKATNSTPDASAKDAGTAGSSIKIGEKIPAFKLTDQNGKPFDLGQTLKKGPVALVIFRSANW